MKRMHGGLGLVVLVLALIVAGCGGSSNKDSSGKKTTSGGGGNVGLTQGSGQTFAMVTHSDEGSFWSVVKKGAQQAADDEGVKLTWSPANADHGSSAMVCFRPVTRSVVGSWLQTSTPSAVRQTEISRACRPGTLAACS